MQAGYIVKSLKGHDAGRVYLVLAALSADFVLLADGKYRKLENPKQKRIKHVEILSSEIHIFANDSDIRKICKQFG
jgi:hypothetical protein